MIRCTQQLNIKCLKCTYVKRKMVKIGAFYMCMKCFEQEFGDIVEIDPDSLLGSHYYLWLKRYKRIAII